MKRYFNLNCCTLSIELVGMPKGTFESFVEPVAFIEPVETNIFILRIKTIV
jgi:hypothetical protein